MMVRMASRTALLAVALEEVDETARSPVRSAVSCARRSPIARSGTRTFMRMMFDQILIDLAGSRNTSG